MIEPYTISRQVKIFTLGAVIGVFSGITAILFRLLIIAVGFIFVVIPNMMGVIGWVITPTVGGLAVAYISAPASLAICIAASPTPPAAA